MADARTWDGSDISATSFSALKRRTVIDLNLYRRENLKSRLRTFILHPRP